MWSIKEKKKRQLLLSDGFESKWIWVEDVETVQYFESWRQFFMAFDFKPPDI